MSLLILTNFWVVKIFSQLLALGVNNDNERYINK
jgi:hypothetical protein